MYYGARVDDQAYEVGDVVSVSRQWLDDAIVTVHCYGDDCEYGTFDADCGCECETCTSMEPVCLDGTSAIAIKNPDDTTAIMSAIEPYRYNGKRIIIMESESVIIGQDKGEIVMRAAKVIAVMDVRS